MISIVDNFVILFSFTYKAKSLHRVIKAPAVIVLHTCQLDGFMFFFIMLHEHLRSTIILGQNTLLPIKPAFFIV
ncbi:MAG TPA: hypothetical protein PK252_02110 [Bacteroidales bacterium]|nr:hypothetical protein [Bacteroidales bacterium]